MTNRQLWQYHQDIQTMNPTVIMLMKNRIKEFYKNNGIRIKTITEKIFKLQAEYFEIDEDKRIKTVEVEGTKTPVLIHGKTVEIYNEAMKNLMEQENLIIV